MEYKILYSMYMAHGLALGVMLNMGGDFASATEGFFFFFGGGGGGGIYFYILWYQLITFFIDFCQIFAWPFDQVLKHPATCISTYPSSYG